MRSLVPLLLLSACVSQQSTTDGDDALPPARIRDATAVEVVAPDVHVPDAALPDAEPEPEPWIETVVFPQLVLDESGHTGRRIVEVAATASSLTIAVEGEDHQGLVVEHIEDPEGRVVTSARPAVAITQADRDRLPFPGPWLSVNRVHGGLGVTAAVVPNNPSVSLVEGAWSFRVAAINALGRPSRGLVDVVVRLRHSHVEELRVPLRLNLHFTGAKGWQAEGVANDLDFRRMMGTAVTLMREAGVDLRIEDYADAADHFRWLSVDQGLPALLSLGGAELGVDVFFVSGFVGEHQGVLGVAGGVPGPAGLDGSRASGVVVAIDEFDDPRYAGSTLAHELGHFLGLFHTVESDARYSDQLQDTPPGDEGMGNLMYPHLVLERAQRFSRQQGEVMRRSALGEARLLPPVVVAAPEGEGRPLPIPDPGREKSARPPARYPCVFY